MNCTYLQEYEHFDILIEVSVDNLTPLYLAMDEPIALRQSVADVIVHILASLRESTEALDKVSIFSNFVLCSTVGLEAPLSFFHVFQVELSALNPLKSFGLFLPILIEPKPSYQQNTERIF